MHKLAFYYQVWYTNQRSIFESLKQLRKIYPTQKLFVVVAGLKSTDKNLFLSTFGGKLKEHFNISNLDFLFSDEVQSMPTTEYRFTSRGCSVRDGFNEFNNVWIEKLVEVVDSDIDILVNCSDDWYPIKEFNTTLDHDISCRMTEWSDWMERDKLTNYLNKFYNKVPWMQHGHYFNYQKFLSNFTDENKEYINNIVKEIYPDSLPIFLDYFHALWNMVIFDTFENSSHIVESKEDPFEHCKVDSRESFHGYIGFRNKTFSEEMLNLGFKEYHG